MVNIASCPSNLKTSNSNNEFICLNTTISATISLTKVFATLHICENAELTAQTSLSPIYNYNHFYNYDI